MFTLDVWREFLAALADTVHNIHVSLRIEFTVDAGDLSGHIRTWWNTCVKQNSSTKRLITQSSDNPINRLAGQTAYITSRGCAATIRYPVVIEDYYALDLAGGECVVHHISDLQLEPAQ
jgi:hypothetical protein